MSSASLCQSVVASFVGGATIVVYRLWFHPLAKFPGPFLAKVTNVYAGIHAWRGDIHIDMGKCHEKYGLYVRYAPNRLLVNTSSGLKQIYSHSAPVQKSMSYQALAHRAPNVLTAIDKKIHSRRRRILAQGVSDASLRRYEPTIVAHVRRLCEQIKPPGSSEWSEDRNLGVLSGCFTFDVMTDVVFGEQYGLLEQHETRYVISAIERSNVRTGTLMQAAEFGFRRWDRQIFRDAILARNSFIEFVTKLLQRRMQAAPLKRTDIFTHLLDTKDLETGDRLSPDEIGAESTTLIVAGSETSSTALAAALFYLSRYPDTLARATAEVRSAFATSEGIKMGPELNACIYLCACLDEALRMSPPVGSAPWREIKADGFTVDGHYIPPGLDVGVGIYAIHHNPDYFPEPYTFKPERWLVDETGRHVERRKSEIDVARAAFNPFSLGPRSCIGKGLALAELMLALAIILHAYDIRVAAGESGKLGAGCPGHVEPMRRREKEFQLWDHVTGRKVGPVLQFRPAEVPGIRSSEI
ncbi:cytochrome P450 [Thozetella sp. PMI_491]|nr:cytochrome P450 [Thozetella sp. PMI_491]